VGTVCSFEYKNKDIYSITLEKITNVSLLSKSINFFN